MSLGQLLHTVRYLRPEQVLGRAWARVYKPQPNLAAAPPWRATAGSWCSPAWRAASLLGPRRFRFLNVEHELPATGGWDCATWSRLWRYNLHYFDDLNAHGAGGRDAWHRALVGRWVRENEPGRGTGWEPYCLSLRIVNWCKWKLRVQSVEEGVGHSLAVQTRYLSKRLEFHLLGNHLWANLKALVFAGTVFAGEEADGWRERGLRLLRAQLSEQILDDGGHFERSPMYHAIVLEDLLDLLQLAALYPAQFDQLDVTSWRRTAAKMISWLEVMTHPDGEIALFNDAAFGIAPRLADLRSYGRSLSIREHAGLLDHPLVALRDSGYVRLVAGHAVLLADVGDIGPDYLPGHAHADTLGFELSLAGHRLFVDTGASLYEESPERLRQRGTAAHNTVQVDDADSSEVWSSFRVARRARALDVRTGLDGDDVWLTGAHDGYRRLPGRPVHRRTFRLSATRLHIHDRIEGAFGSATARLLVHPKWQVDIAPARTRGTITSSFGHLTWHADGAAETIVSRRTWHPEFGRQDATASLELRLQRSDLSTYISFS